MKASDNPFLVGAVLPEIRDRVTDWVCLLSTKELARRIGAEPRTVDSWRAGHMPSTPHLLALAGVWGREFIEDVFAPVMAEEEAGVMQRLARLKASLDALKREIERENAADADNLDRQDIAGPASVDGRMARRPGLALAPPPELAAHPADDEPAGRIQHRKARRAGQLIALALLLFSAMAPGVASAAGVVIDDDLRPVRRLSRTFRSGGGVKIGKSGRIE